MNKKTLISILSGAVLVLPAIAAADLGGMAKTFAGNLGAMAGSLAIIGFIVVGIIYISASANPSKMAAAKEGLVAVVIGIIILILASGAMGFVQTLFGVK